MQRILVILFLVNFSLCANAQDNEEQLAVQYYSSGDFEKAAIIFEKLYNKKPSIYYYNYLVNAYVEGKNYSDAEKFIKKLLKQDKKNVRYKIDLGYVYKKSGDNAKAEKEFDEALKNMYADRNSVVNLANAFIIRQEHDYAIKTYLKGKSIIKDYTFGIELGSIYERMMKYEDMIKEYLDLLEFNSFTYLTIVQNILQNSLSYDPEGRKSNALKTELFKRIQTASSQTFYSEMLLWYSIQQKDFEMAFTQAKALDKRLKQNGIEVYNLGELAFSNEAYDIAVKCFEYIIEKGDYNPYYIDSRINILRAEYLIAQKRMVFEQTILEELERKYLLIIDDYGKNKHTISLIKDLAYLQAFFLKKHEKAIELLADVIKLPSLQPQLVAECKLLLADILVMTGDVWEATLLYSQIEKAFKNAPIAHEAKFRNARLSFYISEFEWAKAQLDVLKASTSKLIANDAMELSLLISDNIDADSSYTPLSMYARADMLSFQNKNEDALLILDSILEDLPSHLIIDDVIFKKADIQLKMNNFEKADSLFNLLILKFPYSVMADDALFKRAFLFETIFFDNQKAMDLYEELLIKYPGSLFTVEARRKIRTLRGDFIN